MLQQPTYRQAIARQLLITEGFADVRIPLDAEFASLETRDEGQIHYLRFRRGVSGGNVPCYLHPDDAGLRGESITALFRLYERTHEDGTKHLHVDYTPAGEEKKATNRLFFLLKDELEMCEKEWPRFKCPQIPRVVVVVAPAAATLNVPQIVQPPKSEDSQLERLIAAGWYIKEDLGATLTLARMNGEREKTMTHHRPKRN